MENIFVEINLEVANSETPISSGKGEAIIRQANVGIKYQKLLLLLLTFVIAYILFSGKTYLPFYNFLKTLNYLGVFLAGVFFAYSFTAAPATAILLILAKEQNILLTGFIA